MLDNLCIKSGQCGDDAVQSGCVVSKTKIDLLMLLRKSPYGCYGLFRENLTGPVLGMRPGPGKLAYCIFGGSFHTAAEMGTVPALGMG